MHPSILGSPLIEDAGSSELETFYLNDIVKNMKLLQAVVVTNTIPQENKMAECSKIQVEQMSSLHCFRQSFFLSFMLCFRGV